MTKSQQDAEDVVQTVFLKLWKHQPLPGKERAWLALVTVNACRDLMRSFWRRKVSSLDKSISFSAPGEILSLKQFLLYQRNTVLRYIFITTKGIPVMRSVRC